MTSRTHNTIAFASLLTTAYVIPQPELTWMTIISSLIVNIIGSLTPDIDQESNRLWDLLPGGEIIGKILRKVFWGHRSLSHSLIGLFLVYKGMLWLIPKLFNSQFVNTQIIIYSFLIGYVSHLGADLFTEEGLPLLFPLKWKFGIPPFKIFRIKTDHWVENIIIFPLAVIYSLVVAGMILKSRFY